MPKPSNKDLLAERRAIRELLDVDDEVSTLDAVSALKMHRDELRDDARRYANSTPIAAIEQRAQSRHLSSTGRLMTICPIRPDSGWREAAYKPTSDEEYQPWDRGDGQDSSKGGH